MWQWFGGTSMADFWTPITSPGTAWWRKSHIWAHVLGGAVWALLFRLPVFSAWHLHVIWRIVAVGIVQATIWEWAQRENWDAVCDVLHKPANTTYPWLSAIWDTLFAVGGAIALELVLGLARLIL